MFIDFRVRKVRQGDRGGGEERERDVNERETFVSCLSYMP